MWWDDRIIVWDGFCRSVWTWQETPRFFACCNWWPIGRMEFFPRRILQGIALHFIQQTSVYKIIACPEFYLDWSGPGSWWWWHKELLRIDHICSISNLWDLPWEFVDLLPSFGCARAYVCRCFSFGEFQGEPPAWLWCSWVWYWKFLSWLFGSTLEPVCFRRWWPTPFAILEPSIS